MSLLHGTHLEITIMKYMTSIGQGFSYFNNTRNTVFHILFFFESQANRHVIPKYLPMLDPILWRLGAKICPILILIFEVAHCQIQ